MKKQKYLYSFTSDVNMSHFEIEATNMKDAKHAAMLHDPTTEFYNKIRISDGKVVIGEQDWR